MAGFAGVVLAQNIGTTHRVSVRSETAIRTDKRPSLGFMTLHAGGSIRQRARAGLRGVGFRAEGDGDTHCLCFVRDIGALPSMRPEANLLLAFRIQPLAIRYVPDIANHQGLHLSLFGPLDYCSTRLVLHIPGPTLLLCQETALAPLQTFPASRAFALPVLFGAYPARVASPCTAHWHAAPDR
jgi:hypothetical protein